MVNFLRRNKGDKKSLLGPRRFFGKKADRSDSVDGQSRFSKKKEEEKPEERFEDVPEITLEPVDSPLNVTVLTEESTPPVTPAKYEEEGSVSDTISDLSASVVPCLPRAQKPPSPAEKKISMGNQGSASSRVSSPQTATFTDHRGASLNTGATGATNETNLTASSGFSISDMIDSACGLPWSQSAAADDNTAEKDSRGPSWGVAPSGDEEDLARTIDDGGLSLDYTAPSGGEADALPSLADGDNLPFGPGGTIPSAADQDAAITEEPGTTYISGDEDSEDDSEDDSEEEQEGYELVLDSNTEEYVAKKPKGAVWKRMKITKSRPSTPSVAKSDKDDEKYRAVFGADPDPNRSLNKTNSFFRRLSASRSKTPESRMADESLTQKKSATEPQMINLSKEGLNPEDLLDQEGEREAYEYSQTSGANLSKNVVGELEAAPTSGDNKKADTPEEPQKETIAPSVARSRSWNIGLALKRSISGDQSKRASSEAGAREGMVSPSLGLLSLLSGTPKSVEKPKPEGSRPPKPVWKSAVDPNTGSTYYYHRLTRQTTWTKPPDFDKQHLPKEIGGARTLSAEQQKKVEEGVEIPENVGNVSSILRNSSAMSDGSSRPYTKKQEHIKELLLDMSPPDPASVDKIIDEYRGREDDLIDQLNEIVESQPFDEPLNKADDKSESQKDSDEICEMKKAGSFRLPLSNRSRSLKHRVMTASSNFTGRSTTTGRSNFSGNSKQTLKTGNTTAAARKAPKMYPVISDLSRSSIDHVPSRPDSTQGRPPLAGKKSYSKEKSPVKVVKASSPHEPEMALGKTQPRKEETEKSSPVKVVKAPRNRELLVEEFSNSSRYGLRAEKYSGKALHSRRRPFREPKKPFTPRQEPSEKETSDEDVSGLEHDSFATDSVSGLSASDAGFNSRKDEFEAGARSALDDAIRNRDWELAATVTDEMRGQHYHAEAINDDATPEEWTQSSLDQFISDNDWDAVARYIASMRDGNAGKDPEVAHPPSNYSGGPARKRFGARSQLQHDLEQSQVDQSSSWDSGTSFGSEFYSTGSSESPLESPRRVRSDPRKNFAC